MTLFEEEVEDEDRDKWIVWFDDASNALGHGVGVVLVSLDERYIPFTASLCFDYTNNIGEYKECALGIQAAIDFKVKLLKVYGDLALVIHELRKEWKTRDHKSVPYQAYIKEFYQLLASMFQLTPHGDLPYIEFRCRGKPAHYYLIKKSRMVNLGTSISNDTSKTRNTHRRPLTTIRECWEGWQPASS